MYARRGNCRTKEKEKRRAVLADVVRRLPSLKPPLSRTPSSPCSVFLLFEGLCVRAASLSLCSIWCTS